MKIATWNVNGIKARIDAALTWSKSALPDIALLQETKCVDEAFPRLEFEELGYNIAVTRPFDDGQLYRTRVFGLSKSSPLTV